MMNPSIPHVDLIHSELESEIACVTKLKSHRSIPWLSAPVLVEHDWVRDRALLNELKTSNGVVFKNFTASQIEEIFRLRALQILAGEPIIDIPAIVEIDKSSSSFFLTSSLAKRIKVAWPFRSVLFIANAEVAGAFAAAGLAILEREQAESISLKDLTRYSRVTISKASPNQKVGVHIQPMWGRCGSSTAFANQLDTLIDEDLFTIRIFIDERQRVGGTLLRHISRILPGNRIDASPHLESVACPSWQREDQTAGDGAYENFLKVVRDRAAAVIHDEVVRKLAWSADVAIINHAVSIGFAARNCPSARLILDTHDDLTRNAIERARAKSHSPAFPTFALLRMHAALESRLWGVADVCTTVSRAEETRIKRHTDKCLLVLPKPYARLWEDPGTGARWDLLLVADQHIFNIESVNWFLEQVVCSSSYFRHLRIAVVGEVRRHLEAEWRDRLPNVKWPGFVLDLDSLRNATKIAVCVELAGTGISVKTLTALSAGQPIVATSAALRGFPSSVVRKLPPCDTAKAISDDIFRLLNDSEYFQRRQMAVTDAFALLQREGSYAMAIRIARPSEVAIERRASLLHWLSESGSVSRAKKRQFSNNERIRLDFRIDGNATDYLGKGWHTPEVWGRWTDGRCAQLCLPRVWFNEPVIIHFEWLASTRNVEVSVASHGRRLASAMIRKGQNNLFFAFDNSCESEPGDNIVFDVLAESTHCPMDESGSHDERVLGAGLVSLTIDRHPATLLPLDIDLKVPRNVIFLRDGWHDAEPFGRRATGRRSELEFSLAPSSGENLEVTMILAWKPAGHSILLYVNTVSIGAPQTISKRGTVYKWHVAAPKSNRMCIAFDCTEQGDSEGGTSGREGRLGLPVKRIRIDKVPHNRFSRWVSAMLRGGEEN